MKWSAVASSKVAKFSEVSRLNPNDDPCVRSRAFDEETHGKFLLTQTFWMERGNHSFYRLYETTPNGDERRGHVDDRSVLATLPVCLLSGSQSLLGGHDSAEVAGVLARSLARSFGSRNDLARRFLTCRLPYHLT